MKRNEPHAMLARQTPEEMAQQRFVLALKRHVMGPLRGAVPAVVKHEAEPAFLAAHGRAPADWQEAEVDLDKTTHYRFTKAIDRTAQEMMWQSIGETVFREKERMEDTAQALMGASTRLGSLTLDPDFAAPAVYDEVHIHLQPEGYCNDADERSVTVGALYESGGRLYSMGRGMGKEDSKAGAVIAHLAKLHPEFRPRRILDMGCSAGGASTFYGSHFKDAEVHAIDLGASMLRYAHARAEAMGSRVHFHQMSAAATTFPDGHFDLIVSHNLLHEISGDDRRAVARESLRLLAPGGIVVHQDVDLLFRGKSPWEQAERAYDLRYNNEPFWVEYCSCDFGAELQDAGFASVEEAKVPRTAGPGFWHAWIAKPAA
ncbi:MAG TPA: class I SAM-dependent methyltransferase [Terricaulis sp.]|nr:class I SAM-dependent methyltransferase [Terricaulis sp.]